MKIFRLFILLLLFTVPYIYSTFNEPVTTVEQTIQKKDPCVVVIFGASGDLSARKLFPALYNLAKEGHLSEDTAIVGVSWKEETHESFRNHVQNAIQTYCKPKPENSDLWNVLSQKIYYHTADFKDAESYDKLNDFLKQLDQKYGTTENRLFYLATQPSFFSTIIENLHKQNMVYTSHSNKWSRVIIEKPFGNDLESAEELQNQISQYLEEEQTYRIDHYLGKDGVLNLLSFRLENPLFEAVWNHNTIDHVQITVSEDIGIGSRAAFWEETGYLRDIFQNHMMQILALVTMEPPAIMNEQNLHQARVDVLRSISLHERDIVRAQYGPGIIQNKNVVGYTQENGVPPQSSVESFVAAKLFINNDRWNGVPFYIRGGKRLPYQTAEVAIVFKKSNVLFMKIQPNPSIYLKVASKVPGISNQVQPAVFGYSLEKYFQKQAPEAYEKLIYDSIQGKDSSFVQWEEQKAAWELLNPILKNWKNRPYQPILVYPAGTWGPEEANDLIKADGREWLLLEDALKEAI